MKKIKVSELPLWNDIKGLFVMGVNSLNQSVKVPITELYSLDVYNSVLESVNEALEAALTGDLPPRRPDVEFADAILQRVNTALEALLNGALPLPEPEPEPQPTAARKGDPLTGVVLRRGVMPYNSRPYEVYQALAETGRSGAIKVCFKSGEDVVDITDLFGEAVHVSDIHPADFIEITDEGRVLVHKTESEDKYFVEFTALSGEKFKYLTKNSEGRLVRPLLADYQFRKAAPPLNLNGFTFVPGDEEEKTYAYFKDGDGNKYDVQQRVSRGTRQRSVVEGWIDKRIKRWRYFKKLRKVGVIRVRRRTQSTNSDWVYYTVYQRNGEFAYKKI